ncbi:MAG: hypothetical protein DHS20C18_18710 [Saprospiraceae bacterium]|nr:MAG: hypothetical protein DHS20C18_18710 [Saprospiraceae bacterium]
MNSVEILSIGGYEKASMLKANVEKALQSLEVELPVIEVTGLDALIEADISAIPALRVNGKIVTQKNVPSVEDLIVLFRTIFPHPDFFNPKILVPTDFSQTAKGAYLFALEFANNKQVSVNLIHLFHPEVDPAYPYLSANSKSFLETKKKLLRHFKTRDLPPDLGGETAAKNVNTVLQIGIPAQEIVRLSANPDIQLIIMGTTGESGLLNKLFGSVSTTVAQQAHCPVLLIPDGVKFKGFRNVLFASNHAAADEVLLKKAIDFAGLSEANIHFVHVDKGGSPGGNKKEPEVEKKVKEKMPNLVFKMENITQNSFLPAINEYIKKNDIDLVIMATLRRGFIENILHKSMTKRMALNTDIPLMVMHFDD